MLVAVLTAWDALLAIAWQLMAGYAMLHSCQVSLQPVCQGNGCVGFGLHYAHIPFCGGKVCALSLQLALQAGHVRCKLAVALLLDAGQRLARGAWSEAEGGNGLTDGLLAPALCLHLHINKLLQGCHLRNQFLVHMRCRPLSKLCLQFADAQISCSQAIRPRLCLGFKLHSSFVNGLLLLCQLSLQGRDLLPTHSDLSFPEPLLINPISTHLSSSCPWMRLLLLLPIIAATCIIPLLHRRPHQNFHLFLGSL
mmetsp:Transcript_15372/g.41601  ORF Transcript_15372/g.41601 Transcript_15372/m.41601 type:complete len:252 (+) Transcript_15372:167-922(+)